MKKILCYCAIFLLVLVIAIPPLTRIFYKEKEEVIIPDKYYMLTCTKASYTIYEAYRNDEALSIKFRRLLIDNNLDELSENNALEFNLDKEIKQLVNANTEDSTTEEKYINYLLEYRNIVDDKLVGLSNYRLPLDSQIAHYQSYGYTCQKIEQ